MILGVTGHRPGKLGGYGEVAFNILRRVATKHICSLKPEYVISGMALGWDQACVQACLDLGIPFHAAIPFHGQEAKWPPTHQQYYCELLTKASEIYVVGSEYSPAVMQKRNEWIVDESDKLLAMFNGEKVGGTWGCIWYAEKVGVEVVNIYPEWEKEAWYER